MAQLNSGGAAAARLVAGSRNTAGGALRGRGGPSGSVPIVMDQDVVCSVRLQLLLYFSFWYDLLFGVLHVITAWYKFHWVKGAPVMIFAMINLLMCIVVEPTRLYIGYAGNLGEKVPQLLLFNLFCFLPCMSWFIVELILIDVLPDFKPGRCSEIPDKACILPIEKACWMVQIAMLFLQLLLGIRALRGVIREKSARFFRSLAVGQPDGSRDEQVPLLGRGSAEPARTSLGAGADVAPSDQSGRPAANLIGRGSHAPPQGEGGNQRRPHID